ncbi:adenosine deaminase [Psychrosphaera ytuae]|uniref:Adenosine deaminase n=1 Tax=Psychrosphaera ytuae TaxID=2820710 RepID=A0A975DBI2_9GAMM|nr:adenosine deaminase [Psychrosphaera ytuae]QTH63818.1 adenosine deaminase [Psychrosphaera ytuae]
MINKQLPLVDLHRHLDGNIAPKSVWELAQKHNIELPGNSLEEFTPHAQIQGQTSDLLAFLEKLDYGVSVLADFDAVYRVAYENVADAKAQQLDYTELRFSPHYMAMAFNLDMTELVNVVADAVAAGSRDFGVKTNLIGILSRTFGTETCMKELDAILAHKDKVIALDLAGDELNFPATQFVDHFKKARDAGLQITVHAGEAAGPESIWDAINLLGATRIGHGVAAIKDMKLMDYLVENTISIESCPTSNYQTATISDIRQHPLRTFFDHGVNVFLNTDDPAVSNIDILNEYKVAQEILGFNSEELSQIQRNGVKAAFLSDTEKQALFDSKK